MIPTVRVANPAQPDQYMTINASDYRELVHGPLWAVQAPDFEGLPPPPPVVHNQAERDYAGALMLDVMAFEALRGDREWHALSPDKRLLLLRDQRQEFEKYRDGWLRDRQESAAQQPSMFAPGRAAQVEPGETPGHPVDAATGQPLELTDAESAKLAQQLIVGGDQRGNALGQAATPPSGEPAAPTPAPATPAPATPAPAVPPAAPSWAAPAPAAPPAAGAANQQPADKPLTVEKGPGSKYYVMRGKEVLSQGYAKKADAEQEMARLQ